MAFAMCESSPLPNGGCRRACLCVVVRVDHGHNSVGRDYDDRILGGGWANRVMIGVGFDNRRSGNKRAGRYRGSDDPRDGDLGMHLRTPAKPVAYGDTWPGGGLEWAGLVNGGL